MAGIILLFSISLVCFIMVITNTGKDSFFSWLTVAVISTGFLVVDMQVRNTTKEIEDATESLAHYIMGGLFEIHKVLKQGLIEEEEPENEQDTLGKLS